jgi:hypothetical protein
MEIVVKGMCWGHYRRELRGMPMAVALATRDGKKKSSVVKYGCRRPTYREKRLALFEWEVREARVTPEPMSGCLLWLGDAFPTGYGALGNHRDPWGGYAHRAALYFTGVVLPKGRKFHVRHICDNPGCVAVAHLRLGTAQENMLDREAKRRGRFSHPGWKPRTQCIRGHGCGYRVTPSGSRWCPECARLRSRKAA